MLKNDFLLLKKKNIVSIMLTLCTSQINSWNMTGGVIVAKMHSFLHKNGSRNSYYHNSRIISLNINGVVMQMHTKVLNISYFRGGG